MATGPAHDQAGQQAAPRVPRVVDLFRHLDDVRLRSYEGAGPREERNKVFKRAVELLDPVVTAILEETSATFLEGAGEIRHVSPATDGDGGLTAFWELAWPEQRAAVDRHHDHPGDNEGLVEPIKVVAWFGSRFTHGHLSGRTAGQWPLQVLDEADAQRQDPIVRAIVEAELHQVIYDAGWHVVRSYAKLHG